MNRKLYPLLILLISLSTSLWAQESEHHIIFSYDAAGNQTAREYICINCSSVSKKSEAQFSEEKGTKDASVAKTEKTILESFILYPNPIDSMLHIEWINGASFNLQELSIYALDGRLLYSAKPTSGESRSNIDCSGLPSATYILRASYSNGSSQMHKIIKN